MSANEISEEFRLVGLVIFALDNCHGETEKVAKVARSLLGVSSPLLQLPQFRRRGPLLSRRRPLRPSSGSRDDIKKLAHGLVSHRMRQILREITMQHQAFGLFINPMNCTSMNVTW